MKINIFELENQMIPVKHYQKLYGEMPQMCKDVVDGPPEGLGIGRNEELGWFILGCGQGPHLCWRER